MGSSSGKITTPRRKTGEKGLPQPSRTSTGAPVSDPHDLWSRYETPTGWSLLREHSLRLSGIPRHSCDPMDNDPYLLSQDYFPKSAFPAEAVAFIEGPIGRYEPASIRQMRALLICGYLQESSAPKVSTPLRQSSTSSRQVSPRKGVASTTRRTAASPPADTPEQQRVRDLQAQLRAAKLEAARCAATAPSPSPASRSVPQTAAATRKRRGSPTESEPPRSSRRLRLVGPRRVQAYFDEGAVESTGGSDNRADSLDDFIDDGEPTGFDDDSLVLAGDEDESGVIEQAVEMSGALRMSTEDGTPEAAAQGAPEADSGLPCQRCFRNLHVSGTGDCRWAEDSQCSRCTELKKPCVAVSVSCDECCILLMSDA